MSLAIKYRKDIDGLRAVAVLLVIFSHAGVPGFTGGYLGVDVFFVISGFLITFMIVSEVEAQHFSFSNFYLRRIRRLMPAFFSVAFSTALLSSFLLLPEDLRLFNQSLIFSSLSLGNIFFWQQDLRYFAPASAEQPLLHTWSLGVEEQFYLFWPLFVLLCYRYLGWRVLVIFTAAILALSLLGSELAASSYSYKPEAYYLLPFRMFEMMMGGLVALTYTKLPVLENKVSSLLSLLAATMILAPAVILNETSTFPGINAFIPSLGTCLLIITGKQHLIATNRLLATRPMRGIGAISYSLYLWHWPILAFIQYHNIPMNWITTSWIIALTFLLSYLTWK